MKGKRLPKKRESHLETHFHLLLRGWCLADRFEREYKFHPVRKWRFDFADPHGKVAVEIEGGAFSGGRHTRGAGFIADCEKYNAAILMGWRVFRFATKEQMRNFLGHYEAVNAPKA